MLIMPEYEPPHTETARTGRERERGEESVERCREEREERSEERGEREREKHTHKKKEKDMKSREN